MYKPEFKEIEDERWRWKMKKVVQARRQYRGGGGRRPTQKIFRPGDVIQ